MLEHRVSRKPDLAVDAHAFAARRRTDERHRLLTRFPIPSSPQRKSRCHQGRCILPSVIPCKPTDGRLARLISRSSTHAAGLAAVEDREIERAIRMQESVGLQGITDGEFRRSWWHLDFLWGLEGIGKHVLEEAVPFVGATPRREGVRIDGKIGFSGHAMLEHFEFLRSRTRRTPKVTIPAPSALYGRPALPPIDSRVYPDRDEMFADLGEAYRAAVRAFADAGCRYLQLDEVFLAMLCDPKYREKMVARGDDPSKLVQLYARSDQYRDRRRTARYDGRDAPLPRQFSVYVHGLRRILGYPGGAIRVDRCRCLLYGI